MKRANDHSWGGSLTFVIISVFYNSRVTDNVRNNLR